MNKEVIRKRVLYSLVFPLSFVALLWLIKMVELTTNSNWVSYGILPRTIEGLKGIFLAPLIHGDWNHLINNSIPLLILGWAIYHFYKSIANRVVLWSYIMAGFHTWISAREAFHIGASGLVYALFGFLLISGFIRRHIPLVALSFLVAFMYGSLIWGILPWDQKISWEGHFWGLFAGLVLAFYYRKQGPQKKKYEWEEEEEDDDEEDEGSPPSIQPNVVYHFVPSEKKD